VSRESLSHVYVHTQRQKPHETKRRYALEWTVVSLLNEPSLERVREHKLLTSQASILKKETRARALCQKRGITRRARFSEHTRDLLAEPCGPHRLFRKDSDSD
jgi:hypothetical protein